MPQKVVYCTKDDIQRIIKRIQFSDTTKVTLSDIGYYIDTICGMIDGELRKLGATLPLNETSNPITMGILKTLATYGSASLAESAVWGAVGNKGESNYAEVLQNKFDVLLKNIQENPMMLSDIVTSSVRHMKSNTEDMNEGEADEGDEVFTKTRIDDFKKNNKILSPSEKDSPDGTITGGIDRTRV